MSVRLLKVAEPPYKNNDELFASVGVLDTPKPQVTKDLPYLVYVQGTFANRMSGEVFESHPSGRFNVCKNIHIADVVVWTGGEDISPSLYNSKPIPGTHFWSDRDVDDVKALNYAKGKVLVGICRGAQLLNCTPNGGSLWQDVDGHGGVNHLVNDFVTGKSVVTNSLHHQMMRPTNKALVVAGCYRAHRKDTYEEGWRRGRDSKDYEIDPEVVWYPDTASLLFQGHPEFGHKETTEYFHDLITRYIMPELEKRLERKQLQTM